MTRSSVVVLVLTVVFAVGILVRARRAHVSERHTLGWLLVCAGIAALAIWRDGIDRLAAAMGIYYPPSALFFVASGALLWLVYRQSLELSTQRARTDRLAQELAVLAAELDRARTPPPER